MGIIATEEITLNNATPIINSDYTQEDFDNLIFTLVRGSVFTFEGMSFEDCAQNIEVAKSENSQFAYVYIEPGSTLFSVYGENCCLVCHAD